MGIVRSIDATFWREQCKLLLEKFDKTYTNYHGETSEKNFTLWKRHRPVLDHVEGVLEILEREERKAKMKSFLDAVFACLTAYDLPAQHAAFNRLVCEFYDLMMRAKLEREIIRNVGYGAFGPTSENLARQSVLGSLTK